MERSKILLICFSLLTIVSFPLIGSAQQTDINIKEVLQKAAPAFPAQENRAEIIEQVSAGFKDLPEPGDPPRPELVQVSINARRADALQNILYTETTLSSPAWKRAIVMFAESSASLKGLALQKLYANVGLIAKIQADARYVSEDDEPLPESAVRGDEVVLTLAIVSAAEIVDDQDARSLLATIARDNSYEIVRTSAKQALENNP